MELLLVTIVSFNAKIVVNHPEIAQFVKEIEELVLELDQFHIVHVKMENSMMVLTFTVKVIFYK